MLTRILIASEPNTKVQWRSRTGRSIFVVARRCQAWSAISEHSDNEGKLMDKQQTTELIPDFLGEDRHEFVEKLAHQLWEERGRPFGSAEVDWFAAEVAVYSSLLAAGLIAASADGLHHMAEKIYK
jgi:hypothetical protein